MKVFLALVTVTAISIATVSNFASADQIGPYQTRLNYQSMSSVSLTAHTLNNLWQLPVKCGYQALQILMTAADQGVLSIETIRSQSGTAEQIHAAEKILSDAIDQAVHQAMQSSDQSQCRMQAIETGGCLKAAVIRTPRFVSTLGRRRTF